MKILARKRWWLLLIPLLLVSFGLWRVQEVRSWMPRSAPLLTVASSSAISETPIFWREDGLRLLRYNSNEFVAPPSSEQRRNWNNVPVPLHLPDGDLNSWMAVGADGREVLKVQNETLELWRAGKKSYSKVVDLPPPSALAISPDGARWAIASHQSGVIPSKDRDDFSFDSVTLWDARSKSQMTRLYGKLGSITALEFSPDSRLLAAVAVDGWAFVWNASDGKLVRKWRAHPWVAATVAWSPDSQILATGANPRLSQAVGWTISFVNGVSIGFGGEGLMGGQGTMDGHIGTVARPLNVKVDAKDDLTVNGQTDRSLRLWNVNSGQMLRKWESRTGVCSAQFSPDGREIAVGTHGQALIFDAVNLKIARRLPMKNNPNWPASVAWAPDGKTLAVACAPELSLWRAH